MVCPPFVYLRTWCALLRGPDVAVGAQDLCAERTGAYTGEVSAAMLKDVGCKYVIVGHSERRRCTTRTTCWWRANSRRRVKRGLTPILCVGETLEEREAARTEAVVARQLDAVIAMTGVGGFRRGGARLRAGLGHRHGPQRLAGTGAGGSCIHLRSRIAAQDAKIGGRVRILYGGSVKAANAAELFSMPDVDGGLMGGASLSADEFLEICAAAAARH